MCLDEEHPGAEVEIMGQNPGANELRAERLVEWDFGKSERWESYPQPAPYLGKTGYMMERQFFPLAGLTREKVNLRNAVRCRLGNRNELPGIDLSMMKAAVQHCQRTYGPKSREGIRLIIAEGEYALYATTGEDGSHAPGRKISRTISGWRGWLLPFNPPDLPQQVFSEVWHPSPGQISVLPTYHLAYLFRSPWERPVCQADWAKAARILRGTWPEPFPLWNESPPPSWPVASAFDTEFYEREDATTHLIRWSMAYRGAQGAPRLWCVEAGQWPTPLVPPFARVYFHNVEADIHHLLDILQVKMGRVQEEDTMYMHAVLWPDLDHDLDFCGSVYAKTNRWKHLFLTNPKQYAAGDALGTYDLAMALEQEFARDPRSEWVYSTLTRPLIPIIRQARRAGVRVEQDRVQRALDELDALQRSLKDRARALAGFPINLGSDDQVRHWLYDVEQVQINPISGRSRLRGWRP